MSQLQRWPVAVDAPFHSVSGIGVDFSSSARSRAYPSVDIFCPPYINVYSLPSMAHSPLVLSIRWRVSSVFDVPLNSFPVVAGRLSGFLQQKPNAGCKSLHD